MVRLLSGEVLGPMEKNQKSVDMADAPAPAREAGSHGAPRPAKRATGRAPRTGSTAGTAKANHVSGVSAGSAGSGKSKVLGKRANRVRETRIERMMSKAELARRAGLSVLTIDRVEKGLGCRMDTKRKILEALGLSLADRFRVFGEEE